jgi:hypothetical protein
MEFGRSVTVGTFDAAAIIIAAFCSAAANEKSRNA